VLEASAPAAAAVLSTPPVRRVGTFLECLVVNGGTKPVDVTLEIIDQFGVQRFSNSFTLAPGHANNGGASDAVSIGDDVAYCRFTIAGSKSGVRAAFCLLGSNTALGPCVAAGDAS
jgi:hypothetical protein